MTIAVTNKENEMSDKPDIIERKVRLTREQYYVVTDNVMRVWDGIGDDQEADYLCVGVKWIRFAGESSCDAEVYFQKRPRDAKPPQMPDGYTYAVVYGRVPNPLPGVIA